MSRDARKKEKQRLKRKQKHKQLRKAASFTALDRIARGAGQLECYINDDWRDSGMASVQVLGQLPDGRCAHAGFLVDVWCVGLKDAFGHRTSLRAGFEDHLDRIGEVLNMVRIPVSEAKRLIAGAIRFSRQNGFRLPPHYDRWVAIFGDLDDVSQADLTDFGVAGGLRYVGEEDFLRRRLAGCTVDEFLDRDDVEWVTAGGLPHEAVDYFRRRDEEEDEDFEEGGKLFGGGLDMSNAEQLAGLARVLGETTDRAEHAVLDWCDRGGLEPHPRLREALTALLASALPSVMYAREADKNPDMVDPSELPDAEDMLEMNLESYPSRDRQEVEQALGQVRQYMTQFKSTADMVASLEGPAGAPPA